MYLFTCSTNIYWRYNSGPSCYPRGVYNLMRRTYVKQLIMQLLFNSNGGFFLYPKVTSLCHKPAFKSASWPLFLEPRTLFSSTMGHRPRPTWLLFTEDPYKVLCPPPGPMRRIKEYEVGLTFIRCCISSFSIATPHMYELVNVTEELGEIQGNCKIWKKYTC